MYVYTYLRTNIYAHIHCDNDARQPLCHRKRPRGSNALAKRLGLPYRAAHRSTHDEHSCTVSQQPITQSVCVCICVHAVRACVYLCVCLCVVLCFWLCVFVSVLRLGLSCVYLSNALLVCAHVQLPVEYQARDRMHHLCHRATAACPPGHVSTHRHHSTRPTQVS